jgi:hypothetical protein
MGSNGSDWDPNYKIPGAAKARLTVFWASNYKIDTAKKVLDQAEKLLGEHNIGFDVYPGKVRTDKHTIPVPDRPITPEEYNDIRLKMGAIFDDQKTTDKRQRLPVLFCEFLDRGHGLTVLTRPAGAATGSTWLPYCLVSGVVDGDNSTLIHEIGHAATNSPNHLPQKGNIMHDAPSVMARNVIVKSQVQAIARAYFVH